MDRNDPQTIEAADSIQVNVHGVTRSRRRFAISSRTVTRSGF